MSLGTILCFVGPEYEDLEIWYPKLRLEEAGYDVPLVGMGEPSYSGKHGYPAKVDGHARDFTTAEVAGIIAPGGWAPDKLRRDKDVLAITRDTFNAGKLVATICHGPWILISAGILRGRTLTSTVGIRDDVVNAGATWVDQPVCVDGNIVSARVPKDLPAFGAALVEWLARHSATATAAVEGSLPDAGRAGAGRVNAASADAARRDAGRAGHGQPNASSSGSTR